jgi:hypothetical protein
MTNRPMKVIQLFFLAAGLFCMNSCYNQGAPWQGIEGTGPVVERKVDLDRFSGISLPGSAKIFLTQGDKQEVRIQGQENIIDNLNLAVMGDVWKIEGKKPVWRSESLKIFITIEKLNMLRISGSGDISTENRFKDLGDLDLSISGSGTIQLETEADDIEGHISGSGNIILNGKADQVNFVISGSGNIKAEGLASREAKVRISGSGDIFLDAQEYIEAQVSGSGNVIYSGNPKTETRVSGSGHVRSR